MSSAANHSDDLLRELHHRVKNNFQMIGSLLNLQKRLRPPESQEDFRFVEEHVRAMAIAHQVIYTSPELMSVPVHVLVGEVLDSLVQISGHPPTVLATALVPVQHGIGLDQAIALCLFVAVVVPPFIDRAMAQGGLAQVALTLEDGRFLLTVTGDWEEQMELNLLRTRLAEAYLQQLGGEAVTHPTAPLCGTRFTLEPAKAAAI